MHAETENSSHISSNCHLQYLKYKNRATIIGWLGEILSTLVLLLSVFLLHFRNDIVPFLMNVMKDTEDANFESILNAVIAISSTSYVLSLINILVCSMLLIGIARGCAALLFPWLLYHGLIFGIILYVTIYIMICEILLPVHCFVLTALTAGLSLVIFLKIVNDVLILFKCMHYMEEQHISLYQLEQNEECYRTQSNGCDEQDMNNLRCAF